MLLFHVKQVTDVAVIQQTYILRLHGAFSQFFHVCMYVCMRSASASIAQLHWGNPWDCAIGPEEGDDTDIATGVSRNQYYRRKCEIVVVVCAWIVSFCSISVS